MRILGLDEAGRGSVLGPLVIGAFLYEGEDQAPLRAAGADDSKVLSHARRVEVRGALDLLGTGIARPILATEIDEANVNRLEERVFLALVRELRPDRVYLDAPVHPNGIPRLRERLVAESGVADWVVENKADATWPVVGAASIFAKVARDAAIVAIGEDVGSGYPHDPATRAWLRARLQRAEPLPDFVRTRWGTIELLRQQTLFG
jgi:ribonuclease HII